MNKRKVFYMSTTGMTTIQVGKINKNRIYSFLYQQRRTCKMDIVQGLQIGLSTVNQNLKRMEDEGLICRNGHFQSTGGRKADALEIVPDARISIGIALLRNMIHMVSIDLYGDPLHTKTVSLDYQNTPQYYETLATAVRQFIQQQGYPDHAILGVSIATQGITSADGLRVTYGVIMDNEAMTVDCFTPYIPYPCRLIHDSKAAAHLELWRNPQLGDGVVLLLNQNMGGALISGGAILQGQEMRSGLIEHLTLHQGGGLCYCGKRGCLETYCSANSLLQSAGLPLPDFFHRVREGDGRCTTIWQEYLSDLGQAIANLSVILDGQFVLSGYLTTYLIPSDLEFLLEQVNRRTPFPLAPDRFLVGESGQYTPAMGGALYYIKAFLAEI